MTRRTPKKSISFKAFLFIAFLISIIPNTSAQYGSQIKVMTYNICAWCNEGTNYEDIVTVLNDINPDISGHQEVEKENTRTPLDVIKVISNQTNRFHGFAPGLKNFRGGQYGVGMLWVQQPETNDAIWMETPNGEDRGAIASEITMNGQKVLVINMHLANESNAFRQLQSGIVMDWINARYPADMPVIMMGDFNTSPGSSGMKSFEDAGFVYARYPNGNVPDHIDHILYKPAAKWNLLELEKPTNYPGSDHDPVWAVLEIEGGTQTNGPTANFTADETMVNEGDLVTFEDLSLGDPTQWEWTFEGGFPSTSSEENPKVLYSVAGTYKVTLTVTNADGSHTKTVDKYITVTVPNQCNTPEYDASKAYNKDELVSYNGKEWKAKWWTQGDEPGTASNSNVWEDMGVCVITSQKELQQESLITVFPNPTTQIINILNPSSSELKLQVIGVNGNIIKSLNINTITTAIDLTELSSGVYFIKAQSNNATQWNRVIKK